MKKRLPIPEDILDLIEINNSGHLVWKKGRVGCRKGDRIGTVRKDGYRVVGINRRSYLYHRLLWFVLKNEQPPEFLDHINGDPSDNRIENLRPATAAGNSQNGDGPISKASGFRGVTLHKPTGLWKATVWANNVSHSGGYFQTAEEAAKAASDLREKLHKDFNVDLRKEPES